MAVETCSYWKYNGNNQTVDNKKVSSDILKYGNYQGDEYCVVVQTCNTTRKFK